MEKKTPELRRLLDENGILWKTYEVSGHDQTVFEAPSDIDWAETEFSDGTLVLDTDKAIRDPEDVLRATMGRGDCTMIKCTSTAAWYSKCSMCGGTSSYMYDEKWKYCPYCGRRIVALNDLLGESGDRYAV